MTTNALNNAWLGSFQQASFANVPFICDRVTEITGRRVAVHEFVKRDTPLAEDLGRKAKRWNIQAYVIGSDYNVQRDALKAILLAGVGTLVLPTQGTYQAICEQVSENESNQALRIATFDLTFVELGNPNGAIVTAINTALQATGSATALVGSTATSLTTSMAGSDNAQPILQTYQIST